MEVGGRGNPGVYLMEVGGCGGGGQPRCIPDGGVGQVFISTNGTQHVGRLQ